MGLCGAKVDTTGGSLGEIQEIYSRHAAGKVFLLSALVLFLAAMALLALMGAALLRVSDTLARTIIAPTEIPEGIITSLIGAPFFLYLLLKKRKRWWS